MNCKNMCGSHNDPAQMCAGGDILSHLAVSHYLFTFVMLALLSLCSKGGHKVAADCQYLFAITRFQKKKTKRHTSAQVGQTTPYYPLTVV